MVKRYILPSEVALHSTPDDCWVSFLDRVWDLTGLLKTHMNDREYQPILAAAGTDISHWFDPDTGSLRTRVDAASELEVPHMPFEYLVHVPDIACVPGVVPPATPWWKDESQIVGNLSKNPRWIRLINTLTGVEDKLEVAGEEALEAIIERFKKINAHCESYTWKFQGQVLRRERTLEQNGIPDEAEKFVRLGLDPESYIPALLLYFDDDLTVG